MHTVVVTYSAPWKPCNLFSQHGNQPLWTEGGFYIGHREYFENKKKQKTVFIQNKIK